MALPLALIAGAAMTGIKAMGQNSRERKAMQNQKELMDVQFRNQQALNQQGADLQLQQWKDTNYEAQMKELKKAGLNPSLIYGMGGAGGATAGSQGGGIASGGQAPQPQQLDMAQTMQLGLMKAQKENIEADTENKKANTEGTGMNTENTSFDLDIKRKLEEWTVKAGNATLRAETAESKNKAHDVMSKFMGETGSDDMDNYDYGNKREKKYEEIQKGEITRQQRERIATELMKANEELTKAKKELTEEQINQIWHTIRQNWSKVGIDGTLGLIKSLTM